MIEKVFAYFGKFCGFALLVGLTLMPGTKLMAQDIHFSQFYDLGMYINPSAAGAYKGDIRAAAAHKQQWASVGFGYTTTFAAVDMPIGKSEKGSRRMALGAGFYADKAGSMGFGEKQAFLNYAYPIRLNQNNILSAGIMSSYNQRGFDPSKLKWDDQYVDGNYDPSNKTNEINIGTQMSFVDFGFGMLWRQNRSKFNWSAGVSAFHLTEPSVGIAAGNSILYRKYILHGEGELPRKNYSLMPKLMVVKQGPHMEIMGGSMVKVQIGSQSLYTNARTASAALGGIFYRYNDAVVAVVQYSFNQMLMAGFSYDINISKLRRASNLKGGFEVTLKYQGVFDNNRKKL